MRPQDTKWVGEKAKELGTWEFKLWYIGKAKSRNRVGIIVDKYWKNDVIDIKRFGDRIVTLKFVVELDTFNVISAYTP